MAKTEDILFNVAGLLLTFYGGQKNNFLTVIIGVSIIILSIYFRMKEQEESLADLKNQINTQFELKRIWREIDELKHKKE